MGGSEAEEVQIYPPNDQKAQEWLTVLSALGIRCRLHEGNGEWVLLVPLSESNQARGAIQAYEEDCLSWPPPRDASDVYGAEPYKNWAVVWGVLFFLGIYAWLGPYQGGRAVLQRASADAEAICAGEWWRAITALTVHADLPHLLGNTIFMLVFGHAVCCLMGEGLGWVLMLAAGTAGNLTVSYLVKDPFSSVGISTSCFGALGVLSMDRSISAYMQFGLLRSIWSRTWIPLCAGVALLAYLGTGPNSNMASHLFGFLYGMVFAVPFSCYQTRWIPAWSQRLMGYACMSVVTAAWGIVFMHVN